MHCDWVTSCANIKYQSWIPLLTCLFVMKIWLRTQYNIGLYWYDDTTLLHVQYILQKFSYTNLRRSTHKPRRTTMVYGKIQWIVYGKINAIITQTWVRITLLKYSHVEQVLLFRISSILIRIKYFKKWCKRQKPTTCK